jgi:hypothetical protein
VIGDPLTEASPEPLASCDAVFSCLLQLGGQSSKVGAVHCRNVVNGETLSISRLIELAGDLGIKAEHARLDWCRLHAPGFSYPTLALLKDTNVVVLTGGGRDGSAEVAVWDPLNPYEEILYVSREDFEREWTGHALIITTPAPRQTAISPSSDFCWVTSAGLELFGKTSGRGQNPKPTGHRREQANTHSMAARRTTRQAGRAIVPVMHGELAPPRVKIANEQPPPDFAETTQLSTPAFSRPEPERKRWPLVRFCIAAGVIVTAAAGGNLLLKKVWTVAPDSARSAVQAMQNAPTRSIGSVARTGSAPMPAPLPATPAAEPYVATPAATGSEMPGLAATLAAPSAEPAGPSLAAAPHAEPAGPSLAAAPPAEPAGPNLAAAPTTPPVEPGAPPVQPDTVAPSVAPGPATPASARDPKATAAPPPSTDGSRLSADEMAALVARGDTLLSAGDVASARLFYERAADAGGGVAAIRLGETFDPLFLGRVHLSGVRGDPAAASFWYRRARDLGATDAVVLLKALETK